MRCRRVVAGGHLQIEHRRQQILGQHGPHAARQRFRAARCRRSSRSEHPGCPRRRDAAGSAPPGRASRPSAWPISASEPVPDVKRTLTPREAYADARNAFDQGVSSPSTKALGAIHRECLGVGRQPFHRQPQAHRFLDRALRQHAAAAGLCADQDGKRVQRRKARHAHRGLHLGEAAQRGLSCIGRQQRRVLACW